MRSASWAVATTKTRSNSSSSWLAARCGSSIVRALVRARIRIVVLVGGKGPLRPTRSVASQDSAAPVFVTGTEIWPRLSHHGALPCPSR